MASFDTRVHDFYVDVENIPWRDFKDVGLQEYYYDYYYAEDELYLIRDRISLAIWFIEARSPKEALDTLKERWECMNNETAREEYE